MRIIPATMATQHPDNALAPFWDEAGGPFISAYKEITEAIHCFKDLNVSEYMWDWEGKHADAAVIDRLFSEYHELFAEEQIGRDKFLTFRIPNIWEEKGYNLLQAMTVILSSEDFARDLKFHGRPLFEVILPMTESADQLMHIQKLFEKLAKFKSQEFTKDHETNTDYLEIIPLVESFESQLAVDKLLEDYIGMHEKHFGRKPDYMRFFLACSDSALSSGHLARVIGNKVALSKLYAYSDKTGLPIYPIAGAGSLVFRGGLKPNNVDRFITEMPGVRTVTLQSAFRYDFPKDEVKAAIAELEQKLPQGKPFNISDDEQAKLIEIGRKAAEYYKESLEAIAASMQPAFKSIPKRRDRRQHIGLLAYSRQMGQQTLPRAITFTGAFYSIGLPPEFIGTGRALKELAPEELELVKKHYTNLSADFETAGRYLNKDNLEKFAAGSEEWAKLKEDVKAVEEVLGLELGPQTDDEKSHHDLSSQYISLPDDADGSELVAKMAALRNSLG